jgi:hypothetical protein
MLLREPRNGIGDNMKKILLVLFVVALIFGLSFNADAATKAKIATMDNSPTPPGAISDASSGDTAEVDTEGRVYTRDMGGHTISSGYGDRLVYTGECVVYDVIVQGQTGDDSAAVYDALTAGSKSTVKLDPQSATAKQVNSVNASGALFSTGIYVDVTNGNVLTSVIYDPL